MSISELYRSVQPVAPTQADKGSSVGEAKGKKTAPSEFDQVLEKQGVQISKHAAARIQSRSIPWDSALEKRIQEGLDVAQQKGSRSTLILADEVAVIANVPSKTVVTAIEKSALKARVFTNIDSAVLV